MRTIIRINQCWESERRRRSKDFWVGFPFQEPANDISPFSKKQPALFIFFSFLTSFDQARNLSSDWPWDLSSRSLIGWFHCLFVFSFERKKNALNLNADLSVRGDLHQVQIHSTTIRLLSNCWLALWWGEDHPPGQPAKILSCQPSIKLTVFEKQSNRFLPFPKFISFRLLSNSFLGLTSGRQ